MFDIRVAIIVARSRNGVIGRDGTLPWRLGSDLKHFKAVTDGKPLILGRKTWDSLPRKPLPGRTNIIVSRRHDLIAPDAQVYPSLDLALAAATADAVLNGVDEVIVAGGAEIYALTLPFADRIYLTEVDTIIDGDTRFPDFDETRWQETSSAPHVRSRTDDCSFTIRQLDRKVLTQAS